MLIIEGSKGVGKTTLADQLAKDLGFVYHKFTKVAKTKREFFKQVEHSRSMLDGGVVQDRCPVISEYVHAQYNANRPSFLSLESVYSFFTLHHPILIYVDTKDPDPAHPEYDRQTTASIRFKYTAIMARLNPLRFDWRLNNYPTFLKTIKQRLTIDGYW